VTVVEEKDGMARLSRPAKGWLDADELDAMGMGDDSKALLWVSKFTASVKACNLRVLDEMSEEGDWGVDFTSMARAHITKAVLDKSHDHHLQAVRKAVKRQDLKELQDCMLALDRKDFAFVLDTLQLPVPPKRPRPPERPQKRKPKSKEVRDLERRVAVLQMELTEIKDKEKNRSIFQRCLCPGRSIW